MGITNSIRVRKTLKKTYKMKFSTAVLVAVASAEDKKVPSRHPLQRLARLTEFSLRSLMIGMVSFHQRIHGSKSLLTMLNVWSVISIVVINVVDSMMKINFPMVVQSVNDVILMMLTDTTVKTQ